MTQGSRLLDEVGKLMNNAAGVADGVRREIETVVKAQLERLVADMNLVKREDFDALRELMTPPDPPKRPIGFVTPEDKARYERFKVTVYILDTRLRADGISAAVFRETLVNGAWTTAAVSPDTNVALENAILAKARQLRLGSSE